MSRTRVVMARVLASIVPVVVLATGVPSAESRPVNVVTDRTSAVVTPWAVDALAVWYVSWAQQPPPPPEHIPDAPRRPRANVASDPGTVGLEPCGGDLPPCYVKNRESRGNYAAVNWRGCGGRGCFGAWQISGEWAGTHGLPDDLTQATPAQQDTFARWLWAGGAGCGNWAAC